MKSIGRFKRVLARYAVGLGIAVAVVCAVGIVSSGKALSPKGEDVIRLEPVTVTISAERYARIRQELADEERLLAASKAKGVGES